MAVIVQQMVSPTVSGVLFTADPVNGNRKVISIDACFGLGEALVSGRVTPDNYRTRDGHIISRAEGQEGPMLTDPRVIQLSQLGRQIEAHFGQPQDIEWCLSDDGFSIVQSRPITTLFPIPEAPDDANRVYLSVGHQQMMTDPFKPLGLAFWQLTTLRPMAEAGGRLFVDVTSTVAAPKTRDALLSVMGKSDPLMSDALRTVLDRADFVKTVPGEEPAPILPYDTPAPIETDRGIVAELIASMQASIALLKSEIRTKRGSELLDFILADIEELRRLMFEPRSIQPILAGMQASWALGEHLETWLGDKNAVDTLTQSVPDNVTSEMGLALLDVADAIRPHPDVLAFLEQVRDKNFVDELLSLAGGSEAHDAIQSFLERYGMRCVGEIDITRPRWSECPEALLPIILSNVRNFGPGAGARRFEQGQQEAAGKERDVLERLRALPDGESKAREAKRLIDRVRTFAGYREYPKYFMVSRYFVYKQALMLEADRLVRAGVLREREDIFYLRMQELRDTVRSQRVDQRLIRDRRDAFTSYRALTPPRVLTSDGEAVAGTYRRDDVPDGALVGLPVSAGTIEGRARVVRQPGDVTFQPGDILVTTFTDPSWTPVFLSISGLVTEVGGQMTHGAVIAREYGLPAVVGVENATQLIGDGQRIRVHGSEGFVEILG